VGGYVVGAGGGAVGAVYGEGGTVAPVEEVASYGPAVVEVGEVVLGEALGEEELDGGLGCANLAEGVVCGGRRALVRGKLDGIGRVKGATGDTNQGLSFPSCRRLRTPNPETPQHVY
jgi:hypothetical protein